MAEVTRQKKGGDSHFRSPEDRVSPDAWGTSTWVSAIERLWWTEISRPKLARLSWILSWYRQQRKDKTQIEYFLQYRIRSLCRCIQRDPHSYVGQERRLTLLGSHLLLPQRCAGFSLPTSEATMSR